MRPLDWQLGLVTAIKAETSSVRTLTLTLPRWMAHRAGQHYDVRLVAPDGYQAQRSYSVASAPEQVGEIQLTVERLEDGEVSTYLAEQLVVGDQVQVRGPIGGYFVWDVAMGGPLFLVAGGSGVVPLMAMLRHRSAARSRIPTRLLYSVQAPKSLIFRQELEALKAAEDGVDVLYTFTRETPPSWQSFARRIDRSMLSEASRPLGASFLTYVCGPTSMVEAAANALVELGLSPEQIRTERFGPTGKEQPS
jgi:ferredoxin-NADP reductase